jgi:hypothetical protein
VHGEANNLNEYELVVPYAPIQAGQDVSLAVSSIMQTGVATP